MNDADRPKDLLEALSSPSPHERRRCTATNRQGERCGRAPALGQNVCNLHGGKSPQAIRAAERRLATERARAELEKMGVPADPITDPFEALASICGEAVRLAEVLRHHVANADEVAGPVLDAYLVALGRAESSLRSAINAGLEERRTELAEQQGEAIAGVLRAVTLWIFNEWRSGAAIEATERALPAVVRGELLSVPTRLQEVARRRGSVTAS